MTRTLFLAGLVATAGVAWAAFDTAEWAWCSEVTPTGAPPGFVRLSLSPEIFDQSLYSLADLRLLDERGALVPYVTRREQTDDTIRETWREAKLYSHTFLPGEHARVTADFGNDIRKNRVRIVLSETNYRRRLRIEGSGDGRDWEIVWEDECLIGINLPGHSFSKDTADFPTNDFRYLRFTAYNMDDDPRRIAFRSVQTVFHETLSGESVAVPIVALDGPIHDKMKPYTAWDLDLGYRNLPVASLTFEIGTPHFYRGYELVGRNSVTEDVRRHRETGVTTVSPDAPWQRVQRGVLFRTKDGDRVSESLAITNAQAHYRYLQLRVFDGDDPPLDIRGVTAKRREVSLVFDYKRGRTYHLIGGNPDARPPTFDLAKAVSGLDEAALPVVQAAALDPAAPDLPPWTERHKALIWVVLIVAVGVMLVLVRKNLARMRSMGE